MSIVTETSDEALLASYDEPFIPENLSSSDMVVSNFSQVVFPDVPDFIPPNTKFNVTYILSESIQPSSRDWIGLFKVGWASPRDYFTYVWAPKPTETDESGNISQTVSFQGYQLPGDDAEFYQFCYVTKRGSIRGASTPFQIRICTENDCLVEVEDDTGMIILKTKSDNLEDKLAKITSEKEELQATIIELNKSKNALEAEIQKVSKEFSSTQEKYGNEQKLTKELQAKLDDITKRHEKLTNRLKKADARIEKTKADLTTAEDTILSLINQCKDLAENMQALLKQKTMEEEEMKEKLNSYEMELQQNTRERLKLVDELKTLSLVREEAQMKSAASEMKKEEELQNLAKDKERVSIKMQRYKDERDLFQKQFSSSELERKDSIEKQESLKKELEKITNQAASFSKEITEKDGKIKEVKNELSKLQRKHKEETNKLKNVLRNSTEQEKATKTAKNLLTDELQEVTSSRDKLMTEINKMKKEKEALVKELQETSSTLHALQAQLETVEDKLAESEETLYENKNVVMEERRRTENIEREMHEKILLLRRQLEEADSAVAVATNNAQATAETKSQKTQTKKNKQSNVGAQTTEQVESESCNDEDDGAISELKNQVADLTTRLGMGAEAYKSKFLECQKLEKKLKKMKQLYNAKRAAFPSEMTSSSAVSEENSEQPEGWRSRLEKLFMAIADPDAEEKELSKQHELQIESLQKSLDNEQSRHHKYKQSYLEEKKKVSALNKQSEEREKEHELSINDAELKNKSLSEENAMLREQLQEFIETSTDFTVRNAMGSNSDQLSNPEVPDDGFLRDVPDDEAQFQDALEDPLYDAATSSDSSPGDSADQTPSSSDVSDDVSDESFRNRAGASFKLQDVDVRTSKLNGSDVDGTSSTSPVVKSKSKAVSPRPIQSPPEIAGVITCSGSSQSKSPSSSRSKESRKKSGKKRRSKKVIAGWM